MVRIGKDVAEGLNAAHDAGLVHRDIKPANIWLEAQPSGPPRALILDFGLARVLADNVQINQSGAIVGTPAFMSPEQARGGKGVDARTDLFSLGCVLYALGTGELPFQGATMMDVLLALATHNPAPPHTIAATIPRPLSELILRLLAKKPDDRPATARDVIDQLAAIETDLPKPAKTTRISPTPVAAPSARRRKISYALFSLIAVGLLGCVVALASGIYYVVHDMRTTRPSLSERFPAVLRGEDKPADNAERLAFAEMAYEQKKFAFATRLWAEALDIDPNDDRIKQQRYNAACAAVLAAAGQGNDEPPLDDAAKAKLREQALDWLKAELTAATDRAGKDKIVAAAAPLPDVLEKLAEFAPNDGQFQAELARHFAERGNAPLANAARTKARPLLEQQLAKEPENTALAEELADLLLIDTTPWTVLRPSEIKSKAGTTLTLQSDGAILASGASPDEETYTVMAKPGLARITAVRLETLPHPSLPKGGSGRDLNGSFWLNQITVKRTQPGAACARAAAVKTTQRCGQFLSQRHQWVSTRQRWPTDNLLLGRMARSLPATRSCL